MLSYFMEYHIFMAIVKAPFFSTFATGSFGKTLTVSPRYNGGKFIMQMYKQRSGKRHQIQIDNSNVFKARAKASTRAYQNFPVL